MKFNVGAWASKTPRDNLPDKTPEEADAALELRIRREKLPALSDLDPNELWLSTKNIADRLDVTRDRVIKLCERGELPGVKVRPYRKQKNLRIENLWMISASALAAWQKKEKKC